MFVKNLLMMQANSVACIFMLIIACSLSIDGSSEINSPIISTIAQKNNTENDLVTELSLSIIKLNTKLKQQEENYKILFDAKTLLDNKLSASLVENKGLNNQLSQLNDTCEQISCQDKKQEQTLPEYSEINEKYNKSLESVLSSHDHQVKLENNLTTLELKIKDIIYTNVEMQRTIDTLQSEISLKTQQYKNISLQLENKVDEERASRKIIKAIEKEYQFNLTNKQQEVKILKEIIFEISQNDIVETGDLLKTLISIMKFNEDNVPDDLLKKRRELLENEYDQNHAVVDNLRKLFDDIAFLISNSEFSNKYFCNKKISYYDSTICALLSKDSDDYEIDLIETNLAVLPKDIFTGFKNLKKLYLSNNRLNYLESGIFNNLSNLQTLHVDNNILTALSSDIFNGLERLEKLDLSWNKLNTLQPGTFNNLLNLKILNIQANHFTSLPKDIFTGLKNLEVLYIASNELNYLESTTFNGLSNLRELSLGNNQLTSLPKDIFNGLEKLKNLYLDSNKLNDFDLNIFNNLLKLKKLHINNNNLTTYSKNILKNRNNLQIFELLL